MWTTHGEYSSGATLWHSLNLSNLAFQVPNIAYWDYNANSGDTGGIVDDSWVNVLWVKINWLIATVNLQPWYLGSVSFCNSKINRESCALQHF